MTVLDVVIVIWSVSAVLVGLLASNADDDPETDSAGAPWRATPAENTNRIQKGDNQ